MTLDSQDNGNREQASTNETVNTAKPKKAPMPNLAVMRSFSEAISSQYAENAEALPFKVSDMRRWLTCFCVLDFNVDIGPEFELIYPPVDLSEQDLKTICFSSFPEQGYTENAEAYYTFRFKSTSNIEFPASATLPFLSQSPYPNSRYLYGHVLFQQRKDSSRVRHYSQKSLALISPFEFPALFEIAVRKAAVHCFGPALMATLLTAASQIACWPDPELVAKKFLAGNGKRKLLELPYLGDKIRVVVTSDKMVPLSDLADREADVYLSGKTGSWGTLVTFFDAASDLFALYEATLLGQSIAVLADTPSLCSNLVSNAVDLMKPIPYTGLVREYVTMHSDIEPLNIISKHPVPGIIGFTNPFLAQTVLACDGSVRLFDISKKQSMSRPPSLNVSFFPILPDLMPVAATPQPLTLDLLYPITATVEWQVKSLKKMLDTVGITHAASSASRSASYLTRDKQFVKTVNQMLADGAGAAKIDKYVRIYFANLTARILAPIKRYLYVAQLSPKQFGYAEFMHYMTLATGTQSSVEIAVNEEDQSTSSPGGSSLFGNMNLKILSSFSLPTTPMSPKSVTSGSQSASSVSLSSADSTPDLATDLFIQAVMPDKGVFIDHTAATAFYRLLLQTSNFEAWCFM